MIVMDYTPSSKTATWIPVDTNEWMNEWEGNGFFLIIEWQLLNMDRMRVRKSPRDGIIEPVGKSLMRNKVLVGSQSTSPCYLLVCFSSGFYIHLVSR